MNRITNRISAINAPFLMHIDQGAMPVVLTPNMALPMSHADLSHADTKCKQPVATAKRAAFRSAYGGADLGYEEAHNGAALLFGANPGDAAGVMRLGQLCRTLPARGRAIRAELPESQVGAFRGCSERPSFYRGAQLISCRPFRYCRGIVCVLAERALQVCLGLLIYYVFCFLGHPATSRQNSRRDISV